MRNLVILLFSTVLLFASCKNSHDNFSQTARIQKSDSNGWVAVQQPDTLQAQILEAQNFVADTSFVSPQSVKISAQEMAIKADDDIYQISLIRDEFLKRRAEYKRGIKELDSINKEVSLLKVQSKDLLSRLKSKHHENEAILAKGDPDLE